MNGNRPVHSYLQPIPYENHFDFCLCSALHQVSRISFGCVYLDFFKRDNLLSMGPGLGILTTSSPSLACPRHPTLPRALPPHSPQRGIIGDAPFAWEPSLAGRSGTDTSSHTSRISYTAHFRIARGGGIVRGHSRSTGSKRITAFTMKFTAALLSGARLRHLTRG